MSSDQVQLPNLQEAEHLLQQMTIPDNALIKQATEIINKLMKKSSFMPILLELLKQSQHESVIIFFSSFPLFKI